MYIVVCTIRMFQFGFILWPPESRQVQAWPALNPRSTRPGVNSHQGHPGRFSLKPTKPIRGLDYWIILYYH